MEPRPRATRGGQLRSTFSVAIEVVTPILGGSTRTREIDDVDVIRVPTVRGHLRFWWRALRGHEFATPDDLYRRERALWGGVGNGQSRSAVEIRVDLIGRPAGPDPSNVTMSTPGAYVLWPARAEREGQPAPRRVPGTRFVLTFVVPVNDEAEVRDAVRTWLLFGGYGSRTRRGLGSLAVTRDAAQWLPKTADRRSFTDLLGRDIFASPNSAAIDTPWLAGAALHVGAPIRQAAQAWTEAVAWLADFRQGTNGPEGERAREPDPEPGSNRRPSISNWPEADKIRHIEGKTRDHRPHHNAIPVWPRAGFGLPIVGRFQDRARDDSRRRLDEPRPFILAWLPDGKDPKPIDRLASPLVLKALPLADGSFVPCALWLNRANPNGKVVLLEPESPSGRDRRPKPGSEAPFELLVAPGDIPRIRALGEETSLRSAFLGWLERRRGTTAVAP